jgi:parvulin-like peptidyl-prolyl isomerase
MICSYSALSRILAFLIPVMIIILGMTACGERKPEANRVDSFPAISSPAPTSPGSHDPEPPVSAVGGDVYASSLGLRITADEWDQFLEDRPEFNYQKFLEREEAEAFSQEHILKMLTDKYVIELARGQGMLEDPQINAFIKHMIRTDLYTWFELEMLPTLFQPSPEEIEEHYLKNIEKYTTPVHVTFRQIFLNLDGMNDAEKATRHELAQDLVNQLREDPDQFSQLALKYSNSTLEPRDSWLSQVNIDKFIPEVRERLMDMDEGQFSDPVEGPEGLHIFWLEERSSGFKTLEEARDQIRSDIFPPRMYEYLDVMFEVADEEFNLLLPTLYPPLSADTLVVGGAEEILFGDVVLALNASVEEVSASKRLNTVIHTIQGMSLALAIIKREGWDKLPAYRNIPEATRVTRLLQLLAAKHLEAAGEITEDMIQEYYRENAENYTAKTRCQVRECRLLPNLLDGDDRKIIPTREVQQKAFEIRKAWENGADFESLIRNEPMAAKREEGGIIIWVDEYMDGPVVRFKDVSHLEIGEVGQPKRLPNGYSLVQLLKRDGEVLMPIEKYRKSIKTKLQLQIQYKYQEELTETVREGLTLSIPDAVINRHL